jgi:hypothetical protein
MGRQAQLKRARREQAEYVAALTTCEGTWIERRPEVEEQREVVAAARVLIEKHLPIINEFKRDVTAANLYSLELFRDELFKPLHFEDWVVEQMIQAVGEPPIVESQDDPAFSAYLQRAVLSIGTSRFRSSLASQLRRFLPVLVKDERYRDAVCVDYNAFRTSLGNEVSPFLVQMTLQSMARWYEEHEEEGEEVSEASE